MTTEYPYTDPSSVSTGPDAPSFADTPRYAEAPSYADPAGTREQRAPAYTATGDMPSFGRREGDARLDVTLDKILTLAVKAGCSDIHISANTPPKIRIDGDLTELPEFKDPLTPHWISDAMKTAMSDAQWEEFKATLEMDMSYTVHGVGRFRMNVMHQRNTVAAVFRIIPTIIKSIEELNVPPILREITHKPKGLILVTGPTGSGKSTTLAAMIDAINVDKPDHIMTIEDPIEFVHTNKKALINQREIGADTSSFAEALKRVLRQDPEVILVGELRDPETISVALTAAETGHLVFGTLHTQSAAKTINRLIDSFPAFQQPQVKAQLADTLQAVVAQTLMKKVGGGRVAATEIMIRTNAIANLIREGNISQLYSAIQTGAQNGMHTLDQDLQRLVAAGLVSREEAQPHMIDAQALDGLSTRNPDANNWDEGY